jgi:hypothetical protein
MHRAASALLAGALLLAGCSPAQTDTPSPPAPSTPAAAFLELVAPAHSATCTFNAVLSQSAPQLADLKRASTAYADSLATLIAGLRNVDWPANAAADATRVVDTLSVDEAIARTMAAATTLDDFIAADNHLIASNAVSAAASARLRTDLGLPNAGNPCGS